MRIIKELDQEIVSKILLIAEQKGSKKFTISNKTCEAQALSTRNTLIDYIKNPDAFAPEDVIRLTTDILELSRKCKRKYAKSGPEQEEYGGEEEEEEPSHQATPHHQ